MKKALLVVSLLGFFAAGYMTGSIQTRNAIALELGGLTGLSGTVDSLKSLGKTVMEMQDNINKLQTNINQVKKVKDDISNYQGIYDKVTGKPAPKTQTQPAQQQTINPALQKGLNELLAPQPQQPAK